MQMYATELIDFSITVTELRGQDLSAISGKRAWSMQPAVISHCHLKMVIEISVQQCTESHATFLNQDRSLVQVSSGRDHSVRHTHKTKTLQIAVLLHATPYFNFTSPAQLYRLFIQSSLATTPLKDREDLNFGIHTHSLEHQSWDETWAQKPT